MPKEKILVPSPVGWPNIKHESFSSLGKGKEVVDLLRHMTHISLDGEFEDRYEVASRTPLYNYSDPAILAHLKTGGTEEIRIFTKLHVPEFRIPSDFIGLTFGGPYSETYILEAKYGIMYWAGGPLKTQFGDMARYGRFEQTNDAVTRGFVKDSISKMTSNSALLMVLRMAWPIEESFDFLKAKYIDMKWLPFGTRIVVSREIDANLLEDPRKIFVSHGWPDNFRRDECLEAARTMLGKE